MANRSSAVWRYFNISAKMNASIHVGYEFTYTYFAYTTSIGTYTGIGTTLVFSRENWCVKREYWYNRSSDHQRIENRRLGELVRCEPSVVLACSLPMGYVHDSCLLTSGICIASYHAVTPWQMLHFWANFKSQFQIGQWNEILQRICDYQHERPAVLFHKPFLAQLKGLADTFLAILHFDAQSQLVSFPDPECVPRCMIP